MSGLEDQITGEQPHDCLRYVLRTPFSELATALTYISRRSVHRPHGRNGCSTNVAANVDSK